MVIYHQCEISAIEFGERRKVRARDLLGLHLPKHESSATVCKVSFPVLVGERRRPMLPRTGHGS